MCAQDRKRAEEHGMHYLACSRRETVRVFSTRGQQEYRSQYGLCKTWAVVASMPSVRMARQTIVSAAH